VACLGSSVELVMELVMLTILATMASILCLTTIMLEESGTLPKGDTFSLRTTRAIQMTSLDIPPPLHLRQQSIAPCPLAWTETNMNTQVSS
jgi:hypothetical protein